jgi:Zn-dependent M28 family amino/carboxypeptidase
MTVPQINVYYAQIQYLFQSSLPKGVTYQVRGRWTDRKIVNLNLHPPQEFIKKVSVFCEAQEKWIRSQIKANRQDPYWRQVRIFV